jgi:hypothetical protein
MAALERARWIDVAWYPNDVGRSYVHVRGTKDGHLRRAAEVRSAVLAQYRPAPQIDASCTTVGFLLGIGRENGASGDGGGVTRHHEAGVFSDPSVPGPGIEPGTRGFSIPCSTN